MNVFLVEDALPVRERLRFTIEEMGGSVIGEAGTETDAVMGLQATRPDIAIVDLTLAQGNGLQVIRQARQLHPKIIVVVFSNHGDKEYQHTSMVAGADFFVEKTHEYSRFIVLLESLKRMVERQEVKNSNA